MKESEYIPRSELTRAVKRHLKEKEGETGRKCTKIWAFTNPKGERFLFGRFCKKWDRLIVTLAKYVPGIGYYPSR